jgi:hypothetical protein
VLTNSIKEKSVEVVSHWSSDKTTHQYGELNKAKFRCFFGVTFKKNRLKLPFYNVHFYNGQTFLINIRTSVYVRHKTATVNGDDRDLLGCLILPDVYLYCIYIYIEFQIYSIFSFRNSAAFSGPIKALSSDQFHHSSLH